MMTNHQTDAQMFLSDERGHCETDFFQSLHTFNFGGYRAEGREPFGALCLLNDDTLRAGASFSLQVEQNTDVLLLPIVGGLEYQTDVGTPTSMTDFLEPGQLGRLSLPTGTRYTIVNPYEKESINLLQCWLTSPADALSAGRNHTAFDLCRRNTLVPLLDTGAHRGFIGQFDGRGEGTHTVSELAAGGFVFVIQGVFEVANRLLHARDGLALRGVQELDFEALSNDATLIILDV